MEAAIDGFRARQFDAVMNIDPRLVRQLEILGVTPVLAQLFGARSAPPWYS